MKLWILNPVEDHPRWKPWYDKAFGFVVLAETEEQARKLAQANGGGECRDGTLAWLDPSYSTCVPLTTEGRACVILRDFKSA